MVQIDDGVSLNNVGVSDNVDPCEHPGNFFDEEVVLTSEPVPLLFVFVAMFENVLWIRAPLLAISRCLFLFVISQVGQNVVQVDVGIVIVDLAPVCLQLSSALAPVYFFCLMLWDCLLQTFHTFGRLV